MVRSSRSHRLPQRLDYALIPAPLDLTLPLVNEKSPLPAIIVTPSSPRSSTDFSIAFLVPEPKQSLRQRMASYLPRLYPFSSKQPISLATTPSKSSFPSSVPFRARSIIIMFVLVFVAACHMIAHRFTTAPRMDFQTKGLGFGEVDLSDAHVHDSPPKFQPDVERSVGRSGFWGTHGDAAGVENGEDDTNTLPKIA